MISYDIICWVYAPQPSSQPSH